MRAKKLVAAACVAAALSGCLSDAAFAAKKGVVILYIKDSGASEAVMRSLLEN